MPIGALVFGWRAPFIAPHGVDAFLLVESQVIKLSSNLASFFPINSYLHDHA